MIPNSTRISVMWRRTSGAFEWEDAMEVVVPAVPFV